MIYWRNFPFPFYLETITFWSVNQAFLLFSCTEIPDEVDINLPGGSDSYIYYNRTFSNGTQFILSVWVRYRKSFNGTVLSLHLDNNALTTILSIDENRVALYQSNGSVYRIAPFTSPINDALWHHIVVNLTEQSSVVFHNDKQILNSIRDSDGPFFNELSAVLIVGNHSKRPSGFVGEISQLGIWRDLESLNSLANCSVNLTGSYFTSSCYSFCAYWSSLTPNKAHISKSDFEPQILN